MHIGLKLILGNKTAVSIFKNLGIQVKVSIICTIFYKLYYMHMYRATDLLIDSDVECHKIACIYIALWFFLRLF